LPFLNNLEQVSNAETIAITVAGYFTGQMLFLLSNQQLTKILN